MDEDLKAYVQSEEFRKVSADHIASLSDEELLHAQTALRDGNGRFIKGGGSPNPRGRPPSRKAPRMFSKEQAVADFLGLIEQPVTITKGGKESSVPAIKAIYERLIHLAVGGDWNAIKKCVELHERYSQERQNAFVRLKEIANEARDSYEGRMLEMPEQVRGLLDYIDRRVEHLQYNAEL